MSEENIQVPTSRTSHNSRKLIRNNFRKLGAQNTSAEKGNNNKKRFWSIEEHAKFLEAVKLYGRNWIRIAEYVGSRNFLQVRTHAQKYFNKVERLLSENPKSLPSNSSLTQPSTSTTTTTSSSSSSSSTSFDPLYIPKKKYDITNNFEGFGGIPSVPSAKQVPSANNKIPTINNVNSNSEFGDQQPIAEKIPIKKATAWSGRTYKSSESGRKRSAGFRKKRWPRRISISGTRASFYRSYLPEKNQYQYYVPLDDPHDYHLQNQIHHELPHEPAFSLLIPPHPAYATEELQLQTLISVPFSDEESEQQISSQICEQLRAAFAEEKLADIRRTLIDFPEIQDQNSETSSANHLEQENMPHRRIEIENPLQYQPEEPLDHCEPLHPHILQRIEFEQPLHYQPEEPLDHCEPLHPHILQRMEIENYQQAEQHQQKSKISSMKTQTNKEKFCFIFLTFLF